MEPRGPIAAVIDGVYFTNNRGIADLSSVDQTDEGAFFYTWFKAVAGKP